MATSEIGKMDRTQGADSLHLSVCVSAKQVSQMVDLHSASVSW